MRKKTLQAILTLVLAIVFGLGTFLTINSTQVHASPAKTLTQQFTQNSTPYSEPAWIAKAGPYVHVSNGIATIDPAISNVLSPGDVALVTQAVQKYNAIPHAAKVQAATTTHASPNGVTVPNASCPSGSAGYSGPYQYWWGQAVTLNHCFIVQLWLAIYVDGGTAAAIAAFCALASAGLCGLLATLAAAYIVDTVNALNSADGQCSNNGANLNFPAVGLPFVNAIC